MRANERCDNLHDEWVINNDIDTANIRHESVVDDYLHKADGPHQELYPSKD